MAIHADFGGPGIDRLRAVTRRIPQGGTRNLYRQHDVIHPRRQHHLRLRLVTLAAPFIRNRNSRFAGNRSDDVYFGIDAGKRRSDLALVDIDIVDARVVPGLKVCGAPDAAAERVEPDCR